MTDYWPMACEAPTSYHEHIWCFRKTDGHNVIELNVLVNQHTYCFPVHTSYLPALGALELQCAQAAEPQIRTQKDEQQIRYFQHLRGQLLQELQEVKDDALKLGMKKLDSIHLWGNRAWNNYRHTPFGRAEYVKSCAANGIEPYAQQISPRQWIIWLRDRAYYFKNVTLLQPSQSDCLHAIGMMESIGALSLSRHVDLVAPYLGTYFPVDVATAQWPDGQKTVLPWLTGDYHTTYDQQFVQKMAAAPDGSDGHPTDFSTRVQYIIVEPPKPPADTYVKDHIIRAHLANNQCVIVKGQFLDGPSRFDHDDIEAYKGTLHQTVEWQDAYKRATGYGEPNNETPDVHNSGTLNEFIDLAHDPSVCGNILDMKNMVAPMPGLIARLSDDSRAWDVTQNECHAHAPARSSKTRTATLSVPATEQSLSGPQVIRVDTVTLHSWTLMAHAGYPTYPHKDSNGLCTWVYAHVGVKIWAVIDPKYDSSHQCRENQFALHEKMIGCPLNWDYEACAGMYTTFLNPGDLLIMPPGTWHAVYTASPSFTQGGHFYMYDTMHLTEFSRAFDASHSEYSTNSNHDVDRIFSRMILALPMLSSRTRLYRRCILALAAMTLHWPKYRPSIERTQIPLKLEKSDILFREEHFERKEATRLIRQILKFAGIPELQVMSELTNPGMKWFEAGEEIVLPWTIDEQPRRT